MKGLSTAVELGRISLRNPIIAAAGTFGTGLDLAGYVDPAELGAVTTKSLSSFPWVGNPPPRLTPTPAGMLNSVGLQNPGVSRWVSETLPDLRASGATIFVSIWGRTVEEFAEAAAHLAHAKGIAAIEVNLSCPNLESASAMFAHSPTATSAAVAAVARELAGSDLLQIAKLSPNTPHLVEVAHAAVGAGSEALTLVNTVIGMRVDPITGASRLARWPSGLSGPAIRPIAVKCVFEVASELPATPIVGTGGVVDGASAAEMMAAGATAVGVGTATFFDPRATLKIRDDLERWCRRHKIEHVGQLTRRAHRDG